MDYINGGFPLLKYNKKNNTMIDNKKDIKISKERGFANINIKNLLNNNKINLIDMNKDEILEIAKEF